MKRHGAGETAPGLGIRAGEPHSPVAALSLPTRYGEGGLPRCSPGGGYRGWGPNFRARDVSGEARHGVGLRLRGSSAPLPVGGLQRSGPAGLCADRGKEHRGAVLHLPAV